jgi:hypothetical protein
MTMTDPAPPRRDTLGRRLWSDADIAGIVKQLETYHIGAVAQAYGTKANILRDMLRRRKVTLPVVIAHEQRLANARGGRSSSTAKPLDETYIPGHAKPFCGHGAAALEAKPRGGCSWPHGDPEQHGFSFCGAPRLICRPYCREHDSMAYRKTE